MGPGLRRGDMVGGDSPEINSTTKAGLSPPLNFITSISVGGGSFLDRVLDLFEGADLDLADALAADVILLGQFLTGQRIVPQATGLEDGAFALVEHVHGIVEQAHA